MSIPLVATILASCANQPASELAVVRPWARPVSAGASLAVLYFEMTSDIPDTLVAVQVSPEIADAVQLHASMGDSSGSTGHSHGAPGGSSVSDKPFVISPDRALVLEPGGMHAMLVGVNRDLSVGESFTAKFVLASGRKITADFAVAVNRPK